MKMSLPSFLTIALLAAPIVSPFSRITALTANGQTPASGQPQSDDAQDDQGTPRVARLNFVQGQVSFERSGEKDWVDAVKNLPLLTGDQIYAGDRSSAVIQLAHGTFIRLSERTALAITDLSEQGAQFEITAGTALIQVYRLEDVFGRFEIDTPVAAALLQWDGAYRVQVGDNGDTELATRDGLAEVTTEDGTLKVRAGYRMQAGGKGSGKLDVVAVASFDDWDLAAGDTTIDQLGVTIDGPNSPSPDYVGNYQDTYSGLYGLDELSGCGTWTNVPSYGNCWIPRVGYGWAPYRSGRWLWVPALGWTWLPSEPWGWAPYHYGRWSFIPGLGWAWVPGFGPQAFPYGYGYRYYAWRPALVYFFNYSTPGGRYVGWQPLRPGEVWHRPEWYEHHSNPLGWGRPAYHAANSGVSVLPIRAFNGTGAGTPEAPNREHTRVLQGIERPRPGAPGISAGLAGVQPGKLAGIPVRPVDGVGTVAVKPPAGIIGRPIVTRHLPAVGSGDATLVQRERRIVEPVAPSRQGLNSGSGAGSAGDTNFKSRDQGAGPAGVKSDTPSFTNGAGSREAGSGQRNNQRHDSPRYDSPRYETPGNRPARQTERDTPRTSGGSSGSGGQSNSGGGHSQPHNESQPHSSGGQSSGSSTHNNSGQSSGGSGHSGSQNSSSSTQGSSKKN